MVMMSFLFGSKHPGVSALAVMEHAAPFQPICVMLRPSGVSSEYWFEKTVTVHAAVLPLVDVAVMVAVPAPTAVTTPSATVATSGSLVDHLTVLYVALSGETVAVSVFVPPTVMVMVAESRVTLVTLTICTMCHRPTICRVNCYLWKSIRIRRQTHHRHQADDESQCEHQAHEYMCV